MFGIKSNMSDKTKVIVQNIFFVLIVYVFIVYVYKSYNMCSISMCHFSIDILKSFAVYTTLYCLLSHFFSDFLFVMGIHGVQF